MDHDIIILGDEFYIPVSDSCCSKEHTHTYYVHCFGNILQVSSLLAYHMHYTYHEQVIRRRDI